MSQSDPSAITCSAGCKRDMPDEQAASQAGWEILPITGRWRCGQCGRELAAIRGRTDGRSGGSLE